MKPCSFKTLPYFLWASLFTLVPFLILVSFAFSDSNFNFTFFNFLKVSNHFKIFFKSLMYAFLTTFLCLIISFPFALKISRIKKLTTRNLVLSAITLSMWTNLLLRAYAWMNLLEKNGLINKFLKFIGLNPIHIINTPAAILIVLIYESIPFMVIPIYTSITDINPQVLNASSDLGANNFQTLKQVILPLSKSGIFYGSSVVFVSSISSFIIPNLLGGGHNILIGNLIEMQFTGSIYNPWFGAALSIALILTIILAITLTSKIFFKK